LRGGAVLAEELPVDERRAAVVAVLERLLGGLAVLGRELALHGEAAEPDARRALGGAEDVPERVGEVVLGELRVARRDRPPAALALLGERERVPESVVVARAELAQEVAERRFLLAEHAAAEGRRLREEAVDPLRAGSLQALEVERLAGLEERLPEREA